MEYSLREDVAVLTLDDGKANVVSHALIDTVEGALDRAGDEANAVLIAGRPGMFSGGFDLKEIQKGPAEATALVGRGAGMLLKLYSHPQPVVAACTGHAIAAGAFMLLAADTRIGARGEFKLGLNETAIGMTLPVFGIELSRARLSKRLQTRAVIEAELFDPDAAVDAGFLDEAVAPEAVHDRALELAATLGALPRDAYAGNKLAIRADTIATIEASLNA